MGIHYLNLTLRAVFLVSEIVRVQSEMAIEVCFPGCYEDTFVMERKQNVNYLACFILLPYVDIGSPCVPLVWVSED